MLNLITKKYSLPLLNSSLLNQKIIYQKHKSVHDLFAKSSGLVSERKAQTHQPQNETVYNQQYLKQQLKQKLRQKIKQQEAILKERKLHNLVDDLFIDNDQRMMDEEWYENITDQNSQEDSHTTKIDLLFSQHDPNKQKVCKFIKNLDIRTKMQKSRELTQTLACLLQGNQYKEFLNILKKSIKQDGYKLQNGSKSNTKEKQLFKNVRKLLCKCIEDDQSVQQVMNLFAHCNPKFIEIDQFKKVRQTKYMNYSQINKPNTYNMSESYQSYISENFSKQSQKSLNSLIDSLQKTQKVKDNEIMQLIQNLDEDDRKTRKIAKNVKLLLKKQMGTPQFKVDQDSLLKVQKKIFGNKKLINQQLIFKRVGNRTNQKMNNFGDNWVYCYELPYDITEEESELIIRTIQKQYGQIQQYCIFPYKNMIQRNSKQIIYVLPQNYRQDSKNSRQKIQRKFIQEGGEQKSTMEIMNKKSPKKTLTTKILEKTKKQKQLHLNKSYILFKFQKKQDKTKFLTTQMRLFGLNLNGLKNIKFQDGQSKNMIALTMVPWGCQSQDLIKVINDILLPLKITVTHPNCIIAKSYIFLEMANFYEAFYAKDLLNDYIYQNQRLKCQIIYGPAQISEGQYKHNLETDHYQTLVQKLGSLRNFYQEIYN